MIRLSEQRSDDGEAVWRTAACSDWDNYGHQVGHRQSAVAATRTPRPSDPLRHSQRREPSVTTVSRGKGQLLVRVMVRVQHLLRQLMAQELPALVCTRSCPHPLPSYAFARGACARALCLRDRWCVAVLHWRYDRPARVHLIPRCTPPAPSLPELPSKPPVVISRLQGARACKGGRACNGWRACDG